MANHGYSPEQLEQWLEEAVETLAYETNSAHKGREALTVLRIIVEQNYLPREKVLSVLKEHDLEWLAQRLSWLRE